MDIRYKIEKINIFLNTLFRLLSRNLRKLDELIKTLNIKTFLIKLV